MDTHIENDLFQQLKSREIQRFQNQYPQIPINHKVYRVLIKKLRRRFRRQKYARERDRLEDIQRENDPLYQAWIQQKEMLRKQREMDEEKEIENGWKLREKREKLRREMEEKQKEKSRITIETSFHNPFPPIQRSIRPSIERAVCSFYSKTGVCRYNERCSRTHHKPDITNTLLAVNMYSNFEMQYGFDEEYDLDIGLEFEESERYENFKQFFLDVLPEFERFGRVVVFKVCVNAEKHLRGNVYVQYETDYQAMLAYQALNTRYYAGRMVQCEFVNIPSWSAAICGLSERGKCPKGRRCNYLHVFRNPPLDSLEKSSHSSKKRKTVH